MIGSHHPLVEIAVVSLMSIKSFLLGKLLATSVTDHHTAFDVLLLFPSCREHLVKLTVGSSADKYAVCVHIFFVSF